MRKYENELRLAMGSLCTFQTSHETYQTSINSQNSSFALKKTCTNRSEWMFRRRM